MHLPDLSPAFLVAVGVWILVALVLGVWGDALLRDITRWRRRRRS